MLFHFGFLYSGGGERTVLTEAKLLQERGHEVVCFAPKIRRKEVFPELIKEVLVKSYYIDLPFPGFRESFNNACQLKVSYEFHITLTP